MARAQTKPLSELVQLLRPLSPRCYGDQSVLVSSVTEDSRSVGQGSLFVARVGQRSDGRTYVDQAFERGARAVLCTGRHSVAQEPRLEVDELEKAWAITAQYLAGEPSEHLAVVGITGTNGKTTVASLVAQALTHAARAGERPQLVARLGTLGFFVGDELVNDSLTTPQPDGLAKALSTALERGAQTCVMEVSSHALAQERPFGVRFSTVAFTNLSQDHLDYHGSLQEYAAAKFKLFTDHRYRNAVVNVNDAHGQKLRSLAHDVLTVSADPSAEADLRCLSVRFDLEGTRATIEFRRGDDRHQGELVSPLLGSYNLENLLVAMGVLLAEEVPFDLAIRGLGLAKAVPGRMERCETNEDDIVALVDYAHTPDALAKALDAIRALSPREVVCVFGCGGDRDREKRPKMARAVAERADRIWLTSDNPRTEDPLRIMIDAERGLLETSAQVVREPERKKAIADAVLAARPGGVVLIAGKGHERYQLVGDRVLPFDDREEVVRALAVRRQRGGSGAA